MAHQDDGFAREVEEELRRERLEKLWREYGTYFIGAAVLIVVGVLVYKYLENQRIVTAQTTGARYEDAMTLASDNKEGSAAKEFEGIVKDGSGGYPELARLQLAGALLKDGKKAEALKTYEALANEAGADELLRGYASLQAAAMQLGQSDFTQMQNRLKPLLGDDNAWRYSARELLGLAAYKAGKWNEARLILTPLLVDRQTPQSILSRAQIVMAEITAGELAKKKSGSVAPKDAGTAAAKQAPASKGSSAGAAASDKKSAASSSTKASSDTKKD